MSASALTPLRAKPRPLGFVRSVVRFVAEMRDALAQAARSLLAHKLRAALTIAGVAVGIMAVIIIFMVEAGMQTSFAKQLNSLGPNTLYVHKWAWGVGGNAGAVIAYARLACACASASAAACAAIT